MVKRPRGDVGIDAEDIAKLLGKAGWEWRRGDGSHIVITKPGFDRITLSGRVSMLQFKNIERVLGIQAETLLTKQYKRGRGIYLPEAELRKRFGLAHTMWKAGFPANFIYRHTGLKGGATSDFKPSMFDDLGFEGTVRYFLQKREVAPSAPSPAFNIIKEVERVADEVEYKALPEVVHEEVAPPSVQDHDALLDLMQATLVDVRQIVSARGKRAEVGTKALARVVALRHHVEAELTKLQEEVEQLLSD